MRVRRRRNMVWIWLVITLLVAMATVSIPVSIGTLGTVLSAPTIIYDTLTPGSTFYIDITIADVEIMGGYKFYVYYNTAVLTATSYSSYDPFTWEWPSRINDEEGYVAMAYTIQVADPGLTTVDPEPIARIDFTVDDLGWSPLDIISDTDTVKDSEIADITGKKITHVVVDGFFANEIHDVAVTAVTPSATEVTKPDSLPIDVTVKNEGTFTETFDVTAYYSGKSIETKKDVTLDALAEETLTFTWDTTYVAIGTYMISASATAVSGEPGIFQDDNTLEDGQVTVNKLLGAPWANFTYSPNFPIERQPVTFDASTSTPDGGDIISYAWNFGDGTTEIYVEGVNLTDTATHAYDTIGTYTVTLNVTDREDLSDAVMDTVTVYRHDVAIVSVTPEKAEVPKRGIVFIDVTVKNEGNFTETFDVTTYYNETATKWKAIATERVTDLEEGSSEPLTFKWDTTNMSLGAYKINATASPVPGEIDTADNTKVSDIEVTIFLHGHDVAVTNVTASPTTVSLGEPVTINVTVANVGDFDETFNVDTYYGGNLIGTETDVSLTVGENKTISFTWDTADAAPGVYKISAAASIVTNETYTRNNKLDDGTVTVLGHDIAVTEFEVSPSPLLGSHRVTPGEIVTVKVKVKNKGTFTETFDVTAYYGDHDIETKTVTDLKNGTFTWLTFTWDTAGVPEGTYMIKAVASIVPGETKTEDNTNEYGVKVKIGHHDIAVTNVTASPTEVLVGEPISINVTIKNQGIFIEYGFTVTVKYGDTDIETKNVTRLEDGASTTLNFTWDTTNVTPGTYTIKAVASIVPGETETEDNTNTVTVKVNEEQGLNLVLYAVVGIAVVIVAAVTSVYLLRIRKRKAP